MALPVERYAVAVAATRARALTPVALSADMLDCLDARRPFCFMPGTDAVDRVRMRTAWEQHKRHHSVDPTGAWLADALAQYRHVAALAVAATRDDKGFSDVA